jgi:hypothetical protein
MADVAAGVLSRQTLLGGSGKVVEARDELDRINDLELLADGLRRAG